LTGLLWIASDVLIGGIGIEVECESILVEGRDGNAGVFVSTSIFDETMGVEMDGREGKADEMEN
jgi:hypothetical protein